MNKTLFFYMLIALLSQSLFITTISAANWTFPAPKDSSVQWVNNNTKFNGIRIKSRKFSSSQSMEQVLEYYKELWDGEFAETDYPPWKMISHKEEELLYTVQVMPDLDKSRSLGILAVSDIAVQLADEKKEVLALDFPKLKGTKVLNDIRMTDPGKKGETFLLSNEFSVSSNISYYKNHFQSNDWSLKVDQSSGFSAPHTLVFQKGRKALNMVISRQGKLTTIVANKIENELISW